MGLFSSLFGKTTPPPRRPATGEPRPAPAPATAADLAAAAEPAARPLSEADTAALLAEARAFLDRQDLPAALQLYEQIAAAEADHATAFTTISGDLGATGHLDALIEFLGPRYEPAIHGLPPGINLLQAYLHRRDAVAAQELLALLEPLVTTYSMRDRLDGFRCAILELRAAAPQEAPAGPVRTATEVQLISVTRPVWTYGLEDGAALLPTKPARVRRVALMPLALVGEGLAAGHAAPPDHFAAPLVRGLPFLLAEACWFSPAYQPVALTGLDPQKNLFITPRAFRGDQIRDLFPKHETPVDFGIAGTVQVSATAIAAVEFTIWDIRKNKLLKTLRFAGDAAVASAWPVLLRYMEATQPAPAPVAYALPADPAAHAVALDHVLHFFLAEKNVLPAEKLAPHTARLAALVAHATAQPAAAVPRLALVAALRHCGVLGLEIPAEIAATADRLNG